MEENNEWDEKDAVWDLLGKAAPKETSGRFADDALRAVKLLTEADPWWLGTVSFLPMAAVAACGAFAAFLVLIEPKQESQGAFPVVNVTSAEGHWVEIEEVADEELLVAAADHLDRFSDQELVSLIGL